MFASVGPRWRRVVGSLAYSALVALVAGLGYLTFRATGTHANGGSADETAGLAQTALIDVDSFVTRQERSTDVERLNVSLRARLTSAGSVECDVYIVARNDRATPRLWAVWPPQEGGGAVTGGGHVRAGAPPSGARITLTDGWTRINGTLDHPPGKPPFDTVILYVVGEKGQILLARPFSV